MNHKQIGNYKIKNINFDSFCTCPYYNPKPMPLDGTSQVIYCKTCDRPILVERLKGLPRINEYMSNH